MNFKSSKIRWVMALTFALVVALAVIITVTSKQGIVRATASSSGATIASDQADYMPGATVTLTGAGWASGEDVHIYVNDSVGNTWSLNSGQNGAAPDPVADTSGGFTYSFALPNYFVANYSATATGATSGTATTTFTDNPCGPKPTDGNPQPDPHVGATFTTSGNIASYTFSSVNLSPSGAIPGLIEYCVYTTPQPDTGSVTASYDSWNALQGSVPFSFIRPDGDPSNVPFNGNTYTMGTAKWSAGVPMSQTIVLHVNDPAFCQAFNGSNTCFVLPGTKQAKNPTVKKGATPSFTRTFTWGITKDVNKNEIDIADGSSATFNYTVSVSHNAGTDSGWKVTGNIDVSNGNPTDSVTLSSITDSVDPNATCIVDTSGGLSVKPGDTLFPYTCTYSQAPASSTETNTVTINWDQQVLPIDGNLAAGSNSYKLDFTFGNPTLVANCVTVMDTFAGTPTTIGKFCADGTSSGVDSSTYTVKYDSGTGTFTITYSHTVTGTPGTCTSYDNTAEIVETGLSSNKTTVKVCVGEDLTVSKTATPSFTRTFKWNITKSVDQPSQNIAAGGTATFNYTVKVTHDPGTDSAWQVTGQITVTNPNDWEAITADVSDAVNNDPNASCVVTGGTNLTLAAKGNAGDTVTLPYTCTYSAAPASNSETNTATATWNSATFFTPDGSAQGSAKFDFTTPTTVVDGSVTVTDTLGGTLGTVSSTDPSPTTFTYSHTFSGDPAGTCTSHDNTATIVETKQTASASVKVCVGADLTVSKTANPSFTRTFTWGIKKSVDKTTQTIAAGATATFNYTVVVTHDAGTDSGWVVSGKITVSNPNNFEDIVANVSDAIDNGGICTVSGGTNVTVPAGKSVTLDYTCSYASAPSPPIGTNTATATWDKAAANTPTGTASGTASVDFSTATPTVVDGKITVVDDKTDPHNPVTLGTADYTQASPIDFKYALDLPGNGGTCTDYTNTATFTTDTSGTTGSASQTVTLCVAVDLKVTKDATPSFTRIFKWGIQKSVDKTKVIDSSGSATFNYTVSVTHDSGTDSDWQVNGTITVTNPNDWEAITANVTDAIDNNGTCTVTGGTGVSVPAGKSVSLSYSCTFSSAPTSSSGTNTATASWDKTAASTPDGSAQGTAPYDFNSVSPKLVDDSVSVTDTLGGKLGTVNSTDPSPTTFTYSHTVTGKAGKCVSQDNTATFTTNTTGTTGSDSKTVTLCTPVDLTVSKTANTAYVLTYGWGITKSVDKTLVEQVGGGTATFKYTVEVTHDKGTESGWTTTGTITVSNPNDFEDIVVANVSDKIDNGGNCTVTGGTNVTVPAGKSVLLSYSCTYSSAPSPRSGTNTATASWNKTAASTPDGSAQGTASADFNNATVTVDNGIITVVDDKTNPANPVTLGTVGYTDPSPKDFTYALTLNVPTTNCAKYTNTAKIVETKQTASQTVEVCGPAKTGALTMGFWQNKNGQGIISGGASTSGICNSGTWLRQYAPFQDLSSTATCAQVATYVTNIIKAATCSGTTMPCNAMLKAQMLATALDVYFSDPSLGGNKINAPAPIGGVAIDLTKICQMIDGSGVTATCSSTYENVSSAFGGVTSLPISQMLTYAASQSNVGGTTWYGNVKATQVLAKDAFDAINNQVAFAP